MSSIAAIRRIKVLDVYRRQACKGAVAVHSILSSESGLFMDVFFIRSDSTRSFQSKWQKIECKKNNFILYALSASLHGNELRLLLTK
jgi:hypothetical protein